MNTNLITKLFKTNNTEIEVKVYKNLIKLQICYKINLTVICFLYRI